MTAAEMAEQAVVLSVPNDEMALAARKHIAFLQRLHELSVTLEKPSRISLDRYVNYWLPLVAKEMGKGTTLIPPPDIAWLWHCHRLAPAQYGRYVIGEFQMVVESPEFAFELQEANDERDEAKETRDLWQRYYPRKSFFLTEICTVDNDNLDGFLKEFELLESTERQATFLWQVSGACFADTNFLMEGIQNYLRFLLLFRQQQSQKERLPLVPTYQIDLIWHTHMLKSLELYNKDCVRIAGQRFHHDDSLNDRSDGSKLNVSFEKTSQLWKQAFGVDYPVSGGMYRGEPPKDYWESSWDPADQHDNLDSVIHAMLAGSFSAGKADNSPPPVWLSTADGVTYEGMPTFQAARAKSRTRGVNNNVKKVPYFFGLPKIRGHRGVGYYHMWTREGWSILVSRLQKKASIARQEQESYLCSMCMCGNPSRLSDAQRVYYDRLAKNTEDLEILALYAQAQMETKGPGDVLTTALNSKYGLDKREKPKSMKHTQQDDGYYLWYAGYNDFSAAGCGGGVGAGGGRLHRVL